MIASVTSKDGYRLFTKVKANPGPSFNSTQDQLRAVAKERTRADLLTDDYYPTAEDAANAPVYYLLGDGTQKPVTA